MASVSSVRGHRPHDGWQHITPFLSWVSFIWKSRPLLWGEREGWCHITTLGDWLGDWVDCDQRKVNRLERSDNNSQSSGWLTLPAFSPGTWLAWPPHLTYQCLAVFPWFISDCAGLKISINFAPAPSEDWKQKQTLEDWLWNKNSVLSGGDWSSGPRILLSLLHLLCLFLLTRQLQPYPKQNPGSSSNQ